MGRVITYFGSIINQDFTQFFLNQFQIIHDADLCYRHLVYSLLTAFGTHSPANIDHALIRSRFDGEVSLLFESRIPGVLDQSIEPRDNELNY